MTDRSLELWRLRRGVPLLIAELERIPDSDYPLALRPAERIDLFSWSESRDGRKLSPLFRSIESLIGPPSKPPPPAPGGSPTPKAQDVQRPGHDVFVSYKREDRPKVTPFVTRLMGGGLQVWWDALDQARFQLGSRGRAGAQGSSLGRGLLDSVVGTIGRGLHGSRLRLAHRCLIPGAA